MNNLIEYKGYYYKIENDEFCENPNEWSEIILVSSHRDFTEDYIDGKGNRITARDIYSNLDTYKEKYHIFDVYVYSHSGVSLSFSKICRFDSSKSAYILIPKEHYSEEQASNLADDYIKEWNMYLNGEIYIYYIYTANTCEHCNHTEYELFDSCSGFYGYDETVKEIKQLIDNITNDEH